MKNDFKKRIVEAAEHLYFKEKACEEAKKERDEYITFHSHSQTKDSYESFWNMSVNQYCWEMFGGRGCDYKVSYFCENCNLPELNSKFHSAAIKKGKAKSRLFKLIETKLSRGKDDEKMEL